LLQVSTGLVQPEGNSSAGVRLPSSMPQAARASLGDVYCGEFANIRARFEQSQQGLAAIQDRSDLVDSVMVELWNEHVPSSNEKLSVVALGGYGRRELFPYSDVDLLFLSEADDVHPTASDAIAKLAKSLWDLHLRASPATRSLAECGQLHRDNLEFNISLLDCRFLCGDPSLFEQLRTEVIPKMIAREAPELQRNLIELTSARHKKYGETIFHLEPNVKECPGGLRDVQIARWLSLISELEKSGTWPISQAPAAPMFRRETAAAMEFLAAVRCFLHYRQGRDLNGLTYELQSQAAGEGIGCAGKQSNDPAEWMRGYFRHVRSIHRLRVLFDELAPARSGLYRMFESRKSRLSNSEFSVVDGRIFLRQLSSVQDPHLLFSLFEFSARHGLKLSAETERCVEAGLPNLRSWAEHTTDLWPRFQRILMAPHAASALRDMHGLGVLVVLFPEFQAIDSLVIRDFYHRYTVDEHSLVAIESVHGLNNPKNELERRFRDILDGLEAPGLLFLALLFHDVGKGTPGANHIEAGVQALASVMERLQLQAEERDCVNFLVANHLRMSGTVLRRDIFDSRVVNEFSESIGSPELLKMLALLTYADMKSVNPEALTPWKAEMLWQLYAAASNYFSRTLDNQRLGAHSADDSAIQGVVAAAPDLDTKRVTAFLQGFPRRYLPMHSTPDIVSHCHMYEHLREDEPQVRMVRRDGHYELALLTLDCPYLFASIVGTLSSWGMNILKAEAFSNRGGVVLDTFRFADRFRTLELNPSETERLRRSLERAVIGEVDVDELMRSRFKPTDKAPKVRIETQLHIDNTSSAHSTLVEITAQDRPGLLYDISSTLSNLGCNIEIAIVDTQGAAASDVFYLTCAGAKLDPQHQHQIHSALLQQL
jgi:[protein-PII] uridylyltransferase